MPSEIMLAAEAEGAMWALMDFGLRVRFEMGFDGSLSEEGLLAGWVVRATVCCWGGGSGWLCWCVWTSSSGCAG